MRTQSLLFVLSIFATLPAFSQDAEIQADFITNTLVAPPPVEERYAAETFLNTPSDGSIAAPLSGQQLLQDCASRMPLDPLKMTGRLTMRKAYGIELKQYNFAVSVFWGSVPPQANYEIFTLENVVVETINAVRNTNGVLVLSRVVGPEKTAAESPALNTPVLGTDITWLDITMDFVWWKNPVLVGTGKIKGRLCDILEVEPPSAMPGCAKARLWIDREQKMLMQAAQVDMQGHEVRKMWVRAIQKIKNRWVLRDVEVETIGSGHRTRLHIDDVVNVTP